MAKVRHTFDPYELIDGFILLYHYGSSPAAADTYHLLLVCDYDDTPPANFNWNFIHQTYAAALGHAHLLTSLPAVLQDVCWDCRPYNNAFQLFPRWNIYRNHNPLPIPPVTLYEHTLP